MDRFLSRRETLAGFAAVTASTALPAAAPADGVPALLDRLAWQLLDLLPERATTLGVDSGRIVRRRESRCGSAS